LRRCPPPRTRSDPGPAATPTLPSQPLELPLKVYQILFLIWFIVFVFWMAKQFAAHNKRKGRD
jgi:hypothetical protein